MKTNTSSGVLKNRICNNWNSVFATGGQAGIAFNFTGEHAVYGPSQILSHLQVFNYIGKSCLNLRNIYLSYPGYKCGQFVWQLNAIVTAH